MGVPLLLPHLAAPPAYTGVDYKFFSGRLSFYSDGLKGVRKCLLRLGNAFLVFEPGILTHKEGCL